MMKQEDNPSSSAPAKEASGVLVVTAASKSSRRVFGGARVVNRIPDEIANDPELAADAAVLPSNYNFEIAKTVWRVRSLGAKRVALQMPEGLTMFATPIADILAKHAGVVDCIIMADVTYGACCVDDFSAKALGCDLLVHYGHSCLIPVDRTDGIKMLYVFVDIKFDSLHFIQTLLHNFDDKEDYPSRPRLAMVSTIQFVASLHAVAKELREIHCFEVTIPQSRPLSSGEILGCTAPSVSAASVDVIVYLGDGRFHLEAAMIANPTLRAFRYDPYSKVFSEEFYDHTRMRATRKSAIDRASIASKWGIILGTLGRQGNPAILDVLEARARSSGKTIVTLLLSEIFPQKLALMSQSDDNPDGVSAWVQIACPRLSIDWGSAFPVPLLTPYEAALALNMTENSAWQNSSDLNEHYPMDFYSADSLGPWTPNHKPPKPKAIAAAKEPAANKESECAGCGECKCKSQQGIEEQKVEQ